MKTLVKKSLIDYSYKDILKYLISRGEVSSEELNKFRSGLYSISDSTNKILQKFYQLYKNPPSKIEKKTSRGVLTIFLNGDQIDPKDPLLSGITLHLMTPVNPKDTIPGDAGYGHRLTEDNKKGDLLLPLSFGWLFPPEKIPQLTTQTLFKGFYDFYYKNRVVVSHELTHRKDYLEESHRKAIQVSRGYTTPINTENMAGFIKFKEDLFNLFRFLKYLNNPMEVTAFFMEAAEKELSLFETYIRFLSKDLGEIKDPEELEGSIKTMRYCLEKIKEFLSMSRSQFRNYMLNNPKSDFSFIYKKLSLKNKLSLDKEMDILYHILRNYLKENLPKIKTENLNVAF